MLRYCLILFICALLPTQVLAGDYVIGDGDSLDVSVWGVPELSVNIIVRPDGKITLPAVGDVAATGLTPVELSRDLTKVLESYVKKPIVTVAVAGITNNRVYISGGGVPSRVITLTGRTTLFKLLCSLEGVENVDFKLARLMRSNQQQQVDFYTLFIEGDISKDIELQSEDILYLPTNEKNKVYVVGAVNEPKYLVYRDGLRILDAILECGGFSKYAKESAVLILRKEGGKDTRIKISIADLVSDGDLAQNIELARGDYVIVQEGIF
jgi:polysaccharide export outer membrane protein